MRGTHRVVLELEVEESPEAVEPEDWDLSHLAEALASGAARPVRTIRGLVVDPDRDRLSRTLDLFAEDIGEAAELQWLATAAPWPTLSGRLRACRPTLEVMIELEVLATQLRQLSSRLAYEGL